MDKVIAILLCYNTPEERLKEILDSILNQTYPIYKILIWDNGSPNDLNKFLLLYYSSNPKIVYYKSNKNLGAGGGFAAAIEYLIKCSKENFDWLWFIEDDIKPEKNCLEILLRYKHISDFICPRLKYKDGEIPPMENIFDYRLQSFAPYYDISFKNGKEFTFINCHPFEGVLVHKKIAEKEFPTRDWFLNWDDLIYSYNLSFYTNLILVKDGFCIILKDKEGKEYLSPKRAYYYFRNFFKVKEYLSSLNFVNTKIALLFYIRLFWNVMIFLYFYIKRMEIKGIYFIIRGIIDGIRGKVGKVY